MRTLLKSILCFSLALQASTPAYAKFDPRPQIPQNMRALLAAAFTVPDSNSEQIEERIEAESLKMITQMERDYLEAAVDPDVLASKPQGSPQEQAPPDPQKEVREMTVENFLKTEPKVLTSILTKAIVFGRGKKIKALFQRVMGRLSVEGDSQSYEVKISASPMPNAMIQPSIAKMIVNLGLFWLTANVDELAYVVAHEMTHENKEYMKARSDDPAIDALLNDIKGYGNLDAEQREEIRADLGAVERLIKAGYNPWAGYNLIRRFTKNMSGSWDLKIMRFVYRIIYHRSFHYMEAHPAGEIRMAAMKAYVAKRSLQIDLAGHTSSYEAFDPAIKSIRLQMMGISAPMFSRWGQRSQQAGFGYGLWSLFFSDLVMGNSYVQAAGKAVAPKVSDALQAMSAGTTKLGELYDFIKNAMPSIPPAVFDYMPSGHQVAATAFLGSVAIVVASLLAGGAASGVSKFRADEYFKSFEKMLSNRRYMRAIRAENRLVEKEILLTSMEYLNDSAYLIEDIYDNPSQIRFTRMFNGLSIALFRSYGDYLDQINRATDLLGQLHGEERAAFVAAFRIKLVAMPGSMKNSLNIRTAYLKFVAVADVKEATPLMNSADFLKSTEGPGIERDPVLFATARALDHNSPADLRVNVAHALYYRGAKDYAFSLLGEHTSQIIDRVFSEENSDPELSLKLRELLAASRLGGSFRKANYFEQLFKDLYLAAEKVRSRFTGRREAVLSMTRTIPARGLVFDFFPLRKYLENTDEWLLRSKLTSSFNSLRQVVAHFDAEVAGKGGHNADLSALFSEALKQRADWIQSAADVDMIIDREELWPQFHGSYEESSPMERAFMVGLNKLRNRFPSVWKFEPAASEKMHRVLVGQLRKLNQFPATVEGKMDLWTKLTSRGVTTITDDLFHEIYENANPDQKQVIEELALTEGRVWEAEIKAEIARRRVFESEDYKELLANRFQDRTAILEKVIAEVQRLIPEAGRVYWELLEDISVGIASSENESHLLHRAKTLTAGGNRQEDLGLRVLSQFTEAALKWSHNDQWALLQFLRGRGPVTSKIQAAFNVIGPERVQRMYDLLPLVARTELLDAFVDAPRGLLGKFKADSGWGKTMLEEVFRGNDEKDTLIAREILEAFLYALKKSGNGALRTYVISYLLAQGKGEGKADTAEILKNVLEIFGATGVKIGQFLAASGLLPERETAVLRKLQEKAKVPLREDIYDDIRKVLKKDRVPFRIGNLKGAASIKYAVEVMPEESEEMAILKIFRLEAIAHTRMEFSLLDKMAGYLGRHGAKYGIFKSIVHASRRAVERELIVPDEIKKSLAAQRYIYVNLDEENITVKAPFEALMADRAILSEYAEGISVFDLREDIQPIVAKKLLMMEGANLFADQGIVLFDPDRHAGNYRIHVQTYNGVEHLVLEKIQVSAIDMGQLLKFKPSLREDVIEVFAISQILKKVGSTGQLAARLAKKFGLDEKKQEKLRRTLSQYFPDADGKKITSYFAVLAALDTVGVELDIVYFDFVRAIIQLQQYEPFIPKVRDWKTPLEIFTSKVSQKGAEIVGELEMTTSEKLKFAWDNIEGDLTTKLKSAGAMLFSKAKRDEFKERLVNMGSCEAILDSVP